MNRLIFFVFLFGVFASAVFAEPTALQKNAEQFIDRLVKGDFDAAVGTFDPTMTQAMPAGRIYDARARRRRGG